MCHGQKWDCTTTSVDGHQSIHGNLSYTVYPLEVFPIMGWMTIRSISLMFWPIEHFLGATPNICWLITPKRMLEISCLPMDPTFRLRLSQVGTERLRLRRAWSPRNPSDLGASSQRTADGRRGQPGPLHLLVILTCGKIGRTTEHHFF